MTLDLTLNKIAIPNIPNFVPKFGTKKTGYHTNGVGVGISSEETNTNVLLPWDRQRPYVVDEDSSTGDVEADALIVATAGCSSVNLGDGSFIGVRVLIVNLAAIDLELPHVGVLLSSGESAEHWWSGSAWALRMPATLSQRRALDAATSPSKDNPFFTQDDCVNLPTTAEKQALDAAPSPSATNPYAVKSQVDALSDAGNKAFGISQYSPYLSTSLGLTKKPCGNTKILFDPALQQDVFSGGVVYKVNAASSTIDMLDPSTGLVMSQIAVGAIPTKIICDTVNMYVLCTTAVVKKIPFATLVSATFYTALNIPTQICVAGDYLVIGSTAVLATSRYVFRIKISDGSIAVPSVPSACYGLCYGDGYLYVHFGSYIYRYFVETLVISASVSNIPVGISTERNTLFFDGYYVRFVATENSLFQYFTPGTTISLSSASLLYKQIYACGYIWVLSSDKGFLYQVHPISGLSMRRIPVPGIVSDITTDGVVIYAACSTPAKVVSINIQTGIVSMVCTLTVAPTGIAFCGAHLIVLHATSPYATRIVIATSVATACSGLNSQAGAACYDGQYTYVAGSSSVLYRANLSVGVIFTAFTSEFFNTTLLLFFDGTRIHGVSESAIVSTDPISAEITTFTASSVAAWASGKFIYLLDTSGIKRVALAETAMSGSLAGSTTAAHVVGVYTGSHIWTLAGDKYLRRFNE